MAIKMQQGLTDKIISELKLQFNDFKTTQDRKYTLWGLLGLHNNEPYKIESYAGSNQIIVYDNNGTEIYNSDAETTEQKTNFEQWLKKIVITWLLINLPNGNDGT